MFTGIVILKSRGREIRTPDLYVPNVARYRAALYPEKIKTLYYNSTGHSRPLRPPADGGTTGLRYIPK